MKERASQREQKSRTLDSNPKSAKQLSMSGAINYKKNVNESGIIQRTIEGGIDSFDSYNDKLKEKGEEPFPEDYRELVEMVIEETTEYPFDGVYDRIFELQTKPPVVMIKTSTLTPLLDREQHQLEKLTYKDGVITQEGNVYKNDSLNYILAHIDDVEPIWFETVVKDAEIVTGDGRHRIAVYSLLEREYIKAMVRPEQRTVLKESGVDIS